MKVGLFVPCYIDQFYPRVAVATLELLERHGCTVAFPPDQTCCGQPMANAGYEAEAHAAARRFAERFEGFEYVVAPSGSCVLHVAHHGPGHTDDGARRVFELCEFLTDIVGVDRLDARFPHRVGLHAACHGLRGLRLAQASELQTEPFDKVRRLLGMVGGLEMVDLARRDECCGFGGTFAVTEEAVSVKMGQDRLRDHLAHDAEVLTSTDMSCLMHLEGLARRQGAPLRVMHVAEILNSTGGGAA